MALCGAVQLAEGTSRSKKLGSVITSEWFELIVLAFPVLVLAVLAVPAVIQNGQYLDLERMFEEMDGAMQYGFSYIASCYRLAPLSACLLYGVALTGHYALIKALAVAVTYGFAFDAIKCAANANHWKKGVITLGCATALLAYPYAFLFSNVRYFMAAAIACDAFMRVVFNCDGTWRAIILFIVAIALHSGTIFLAAPMLVLLVSSKNRRYIYLLFLSALLLLPLMAWLTGILAPYNYGIAAIHGKLDMYTVFGDSYTPFEFQGLNTYICVLAMSGSCLLMCYLNYKVYDKDMGRYTPSLLAFHALEIGIIANVDMLYRIAIGGFVLLVPCAVCAAETVLRQRVNRKTLRSLRIALLVFTLSVLMLAIRNLKDILLWAI